MILFFNYEKSLQHQNINLVNSTIYERTILWTNPTISNCTD